LEIARSLQYNAPQSVAHPGKTLSHYGITDLESAKDRIEQLEVQIEALQEHIDGLETENEQLDSTKTAIHTAIVEERDLARKQLAEEQEKSAKLVANLKNLENMVNELDERVPKPTVTSSIVASSNTKNAKTIKELKEKVISLEQKYEQSSKRCGMLQKELTSIPLLKPGCRAENQRLLKKKSEAENAKMNSEKQTEEKFSFEKNGENQRMEQASPDVSRIKSLELQIESLTQKIQMLQILEIEQPKLATENMNLKKSIESLLFKTSSADRMLQDIKIDKAQLSKQLETCEA
jgi:DNA repair exonuclease SbcCD ATPase subunit